MDTLNNIFVTVFSIVIIYKGIQFVFNTEHEYKKNLKYLEEFAYQVRKIPLLDDWTSDEVKNTKKFKKFEIVMFKAAGVFFILVGIIGLYSIYLKIV